MKRILSTLLIAAFITSTAFADVTIKKDQTNSPAGRFEIIDLKTGAVCVNGSCTGGSGAVTTNGEIVTVDLTNLTGVNWNALNASGQTISWAGANVAATTGINWNWFPPSNGLNWQQVPFSAPMTFAGVNWTNYPIENSAINWTDIIAAQTNRAGVNWSWIDPYTGGVNWNVLARGATAGNIVCWTTNGQIGKCTGSVSGVGCVGCQ